MNHSFIEFKDQVCLITGAGSRTGIGFAAAKILGSLGGRIAITGESLVVDGGNTIQEYKGPAELYY